MAIFPNISDRCRPKQTSPRRYPAKDALLTLQDAHSTPTPLATLHEKRKNGPPEAKDAPATHQVGNKTALRMTRSNACSYVQIYPRLQKQHEENSKTRKSWVWAVHLSSKQEQSTALPLRRIRCSGEAAAGSRKLAHPGSYR